MVGMTLAFAMLTGCGSEGKDTTTTTADTEVSTPATDENESESEDASEDTTPEVSAEEIDLYDYLGALDANATDADGNTLGVATKGSAGEYYGGFVIDINLVYCDGYYGGAPENWHEVVEYVDIDGEQWIQATYTFDDDALSYNGYTIVSYMENPFVIAVSPDKTKALYKGVIYTRPEQ